jgi:hypothetical protein
MIHELGEFDQVVSHLQVQVDSIMDKSEEEDLDPEEKVEALLEQLNSKSILCFSVTSSGVACGPSSATVYVAVDFDPPTKSE